MMEMGADPGPPRFHPIDAAFGTTGNGAGEDTVC